MRQRKIRQDQETDFPYSLAGMSDVSEVARRLLALRERSGLSRAKIGSLLGGVPASTYQTYETVYKKQLLPVPLTLQLAGVLCGRGNPPINEAEVLALGGISAASVVREGDTYRIKLEMLDEAPSKIKERVVVPKADPVPGDPIHDLDEAALLKMWRGLSMVKKATLFAHLGSDDMPSLRKSA